MPIHTSSVPPGAGVEPERCEITHESTRRDALRASLMTPDTVHALADTFKTLGDPTRVRMLDALAREELCVCDLAVLVGLSESAVSHQLRLLRGLRLVRPRRAGRQVFYALDDQHIVSLFQQGLRHVQEARRAASDVGGRAGGERGGSLEPTPSVKTRGVPSGGGAPLDGRNAGPAPRQARGALSPSKGASDRAGRGAGAFAKLRRPWTKLERAESGGPRQRE